MGIKISMQREVKERIRKEIIEAAQQYAEEYEIENYTDTASALNCVYAEFKNQFDWKIKRVGEHNAFIEWLRGLPMSFVYSYYDERMTIQKWFNQSDEEASKYSDDQVDKLYWNLLAREFFALVKKFNVSGIIKSEDDTKVTPYDMDDYLDNDNALEESNIEASKDKTADDIYELIIPKSTIYYLEYGECSPDDFTDEELDAIEDFAVEWDIIDYGDLDNYNFCRYNDMSNLFKASDCVEVKARKKNNDINNVLEESNILVSNEITAENLDEYYIPIEYECVEDEDSDSDEPRPYVDYFKYRIYLDEVMRLNTPEVIDGIEYHGYMGISNNMSYMIHIDPSGDAVIVRESGADKLYNPNKKEIAVEESNMIDNDNALEESTALVSDYNGWTNYDTWNVMMWINNDYGIYKEAVHFMNKYFKNDPYKDFIIYCGLENDKTPDKVEWISDKLNYNELNDAMREFVESTAEEELIEEEDLDFLRKYD